MGFPDLLKSSAQSVTLWLAPQLSIFTLTWQSRHRQQRVSHPRGTAPPAPAAAPIEAVIDDEIDILLVVRLTGAVCKHTWWAAAVPVAVAVVAGGGGGGSGGGGDTRARLPIGGSPPSMHMQLFR